MLVLSGFMRNLFPDDTSARSRPTTASQKIKTQCNQLVDTLMKVLNLKVSTKYLTIFE